MFTLLLFSSVLCIRACWSTTVSPPQSSHTLSSSTPAAGQRPEGPRVKPYGPEHMEAGAGAAGGGGGAAAAARGGLRPQGQASSGGGRGAPPVWRSPHKLPPYLYIYTTGLPFHTNVNSTQHSHQMSNSKGQVIRVACSPHTDTTTHDSLCGANATAHTHTPHTPQRCCALLYWMRVCD